MLNLILILPLLASFLIALLLLPFWIRKARQIGLVWKDMNKLAVEKVAGSGGIMVVLSFIISIFIFVAYRTFYLNDNSHLIEIISLSIVVLFAAGIGFIDDLLGWQHGGLSKRSRLILIAISAIPLMAINAGRDTMSLPFIGSIDFGIIYPLIIIPIGVVAVTTTFNFLAGFNGLEAGQGIILLSAAALVSWLTGSSWLAIIALCMAFALFAFLVFNFYPAKVFPGDVMTYAVGSLFVAIAILGNFEKIALFFFIPYVIEVFIKARGKLVKHSFGKPKKDGSLDLLYPKLYGTTHLAILVMKRLDIQPTEKRVVYLIWAFQLIIVILTLAIFRQGIFY